MTKAVKDKTIGGRKAGIKVTAKPAAKPAKAARATGKQPKLTLLGVEVTRAEDRTPEEQAAHEAKLQTLVAKLDAEDAAKKGAEAAHPAHPTQPEHPAAGEGAAHAQHSWDPAHADEADASEMLKVLLGTPAQGRNKKPAVNVRSLVREYMLNHGLEVDFSGGIVASTALTMASKSDEIVAALSAEAWTQERLTDEVMELAEAEGDQGCFLVQGEAGDPPGRRQGQAAPLQDRHGAALRAAHPGGGRGGRPSVERFASTCFEMETDLAVSAMKHFIWQVLSKAVNRHRYVQRHLALVLTGVQGGGKTECGLAFLRPLKELRTDPTLLADVVDRRSGALFDYSVVFLDDVDNIKLAQVPTLKAIYHGRGPVPPPAWHLVHHEAAAERHVPDDRERGHRQDRARSDRLRRFLTTPFRNGEVKGGDPKVWEVINSTDFTLLWRSVNVFAKSPSCAKTALRLGSIAGSSRPLAAGR